jgi:hypothetical protein
MDEMLDKEFTRIIRKFNEIEQSRDTWLNEIRKTMQDNKRNSAEIENFKTNKLWKRRVQ